MPDGRVGHAELDLGGAHLYLSDAHPEIGVVAPDPATGASITLHLELSDVDAATERARDEAAVIEREPSDNPYGRIATVRDPFGHRWMLNGPVHASRRINGNDFLLLRAVGRGRRPRGSLLRDSARLDLRRPGRPAPRGRGRAVPH